MGIGSQAERTNDQEVCREIRDESTDGRLLFEDDHLVVLESLWHAGPWAHDLQALRITARAVKMPLYEWTCLTEGIGLSLCVLRHNGTVPSIDEIVSV